MAFRNDWVNRTTLEHINASPSSMALRFPAEVFVDSDGKPASNANWIYDPDLSSVIGQSNIYWVATGDAISLMDQAAMDAVDAQQLSDRRDNQAAQLDDVNADLRALARMILDELNSHAEKITAILDAIDNASSLADVKTAIAIIADQPERNIVQMRTVFRNKLGS